MFLVVVVSLCYRKCKKKQNKTSQLGTTGGKNKSKCPGSVIIVTCAVPTC